MPVSREISKEIIDAITAGKNIDQLIARLGIRPPTKCPLPPRMAGDAAWSKESQSQRLEILKGQGIRVEYLTGEKRIDDPAILQGNIESYVGMAQVPVGVIGPLRVNGLHASGDFYVPIATTEGALTASLNRGAYVISRAGGARVMCLTERISRAPGFRFENMIEAGQFILWVAGQFERFQSVVNETTRHGKLTDIRTTFEGNHVFLSFDYTTGDASGQNMVTITTDAICRYIIEHSPVKPKYWFIESNLSGDKKATALSYLFVRGKKVTAEVVIPHELCTRVLHVTPKQVMSYGQVSAVGATQSGTLGIQGHYANALTAIFIACGQDAACVAEAAIGITRTDCLDSGDLYFSVTLPNMIVGTVGGGTGLPTQRECLEMLGCAGPGNARKFAEICTASVLAGEISIVAAMASGEFAQAHEKLGRKPVKAG